MSKILKQMIQEGSRQRRARGMAHRMFKNSLISKNDEPASYNAVKSALRNFPKDTYKKFENISIKKSKAENDNSLGVYNRMYDPRSGNTHGRNVSLNDKLFTPGSDAEDLKDPLRSGKRSFVLSHELDHAADDELHNDQEEFYNSDSYKAEKVAQTNTYNRIIGAGSNSQKMAVIGDDDDIKSKIIEHDKTRISDGKDPWFLNTMKIEDKRSKEFDDIKKEYQKSYQEKIKEVEKDISKKFTTKKPSILRRLIDRRKFITDERYNDELERGKIFAKFEDPLRDKAIEKLYSNENLEGIEDDVRETFPPDRVDSVLKSPGTYRKIKHHVSYIVGYDGNGNRTELGKRLDKVKADLDKKKEGK